MSKKKVVILGGGITGLASAYRLSRDPNFEVHVIDKEPSVGGVARSFTDGEFTLDYGPHKFYTLLDGILDSLKEVMGDELIERDKKQKLCLGGKYYDFPLKMSEMVLKFPPQKSAAILASFAKQSIKNLVSKEEAKSYEDFIVQRFGKGLYESIFAPMAKKVFGEPELLDRKLAEVRISSPGLVSVIKQALFPSQVSRENSAPVFHYPKKGFGRIPAKFEEACRKNGVHFHLNASVKKLDSQPGGALNRVVFQNSSGQEETLVADSVIYTIPLTHLDNLITNGLPTDIRKATRFVSYRHVIIYYFLLKSEPILPAMWVFYPEAKYRFGRLSEMTQFSPHVAPAGQTALMVDFTCEDNDPIWSMDDVDLGKTLQNQMAPLNLFKSPQLIKGFSKRFKNFYPIYSMGYQENIEAIRRLEKLYDNLYFVGRVGDFNYNNSDQCMDMGYRVAEHVINQGAVSHGWQETRKQKFESYKIVD